jgi:hypothetical protein
MSIICGVAQGGNGVLLEYAKYNGSTFCTRTCAALFQTVSVSMIMMEPFILLIVPMIVLLNGNQMQRKVDIEKEINSIVCQM